MEKRIIISVGTSIFRNNNIETEKLKFNNLTPFDIIDNSPKEVITIIDKIFDNLKNLKQKNTNLYIKSSSAELNSLLLLSPKPSNYSHINLVCSYTIEGVIAGLVIKKILESMENFKNISIDIVEGLDIKNIEDFKNIGVVNLLRKLSSLVYKDNEKQNVLLIASGSYKPVSAMMMFAGMLFGVPVIYGYENSELLELPFIPLDYNIKIFEKCNITLLRKLYKRGNIDKKSWFVLQKQVNINIDYLVENLKTDIVKISYIGRLLIGSYLESRTDGLIKVVFNKKTLEDNFKIMFNRLKGKNEKGFAIAMFDIDDFKKINDTYGHKFGDEVLKEVGSLIDDNLNYDREDFVARYGGEEFFGFFPECDADECKIFLEKIRNNIKNKNFFHKDRLIKITISIGCVVCKRFEHKFSNLDYLIKEADKLLYEVKNEGKDKVKIKIL